MKLQFLRNQNRLITFILSILGVGSACTFLGCEYGTPALEYGVPGASFKVHGTIGDKKGAVIEGIQVIMETDTAYSDSNGEYLVRGYNFPEDKTYFLLEFNDTSSNRIFSSKDTTIIFEDPVFENGDGSWYVGEASMELDISLDEEDQ